MPYPAVQQSATNINLRQTVHILHCTLEILLTILLAFATSAILRGAPAAPGPILYLALLVLLLTATFRRFIANADPHSLASQHCSPAQAISGSALAFSNVLGLTTLMEGDHFSWMLLWGGGVMSVTFIGRTLIWRKGIGLTDGGVAIIGEVGEVTRIASAIDRPNRCPVVACLPHDAPSSLDVLQDMVETGKVESVVLAAMPAEQQQSIITAIADLPIAVYVAPPVGLTQSNLNDVIAVLPNNLSGRGGLAKRAIDLAGAIAGLIALLPLLLLVSLAIKFDSRGPVFFRQIRYGLGGRATEIWKFRTMSVTQCDLSGEARTLARDPRVTRIGRVLRRLSIDEIPQLINVLEGSMSLVGPRPHVAKMRIGDALYRDAVSLYPLRHRVKPGITGWAQVNGSRGEVDTMTKAKRRVDLDLWYISNWSIALDLRIILRTALGGFATLRAD